MSAKESAQHVLFRTMSGVHTALYRATKGRVGSRMGGGTIVLLTTTGARSGKHRTAALMSVRDGDDYVVIASNGGLSTHPGWYHNIRANPEARIEDGADTLEVRGRVATADERARLWPGIVERFKNYAGYQRKTTREIPLVILEPVGSPSPS
jgi:deazaflavin-dependent oxidoreductase (nitroreductase family)